MDHTATDRNANIEQVVAEKPTLRDQFAMAALTGYCAYNGYVGQEPEFRARYAYAMADAMLAAREEKK